MEGTSSDNPSENPTPADAKLISENVFKFLHPLMQKAFNSPETEPFQSDLEYFSYLDAIYAAKLISYAMIDTISERLYNIGCHLEDFKKENLLVPEEMSKILLDVHHILDKRRYKKLEAGDFRPRAIRVANKFDMTPVETKIFEFLYIVTSSELVSKVLVSKNNNVPLTQFFIAEVLGIAAEDFQAFHAQNSRFVKDGLITASSGLRIDLYSMSEMCTHGIAGLLTTSSQFLNIESQVIQDVISAEPGFADTEAGKLSNIQRNIDDQGDQEEEEAAEPHTSRAKFGNMDNLYAFLKKSEATEDDENENKGKEGDEYDQETGEDANENVFEVDNEEENEGAEVDITEKDADAVEEASNADADEGETEADEADAKTDKKSDSIDLMPYKNDLNFLQEQITLMNHYSKTCKMVRSLEELNEVEDDAENRADEMYDPQTGRYLGRDLALQKREANVRKLRQKEKILKAKIARRLQLTREAGSWFPRFEKLVDALCLSTFEKYALLTLISTVVSPHSHGRTGTMRVSDILRNFSCSLEEQIRFRRYFYKNSILLKEGVINLLGHDFMSDLANCEVEVDRRMLDFVVGLDTEFSEIVDGSHLYSPNIKIDDVILPEDIKSAVVETVTHFDLLRQVENDLELEKKISYGRGMSLLFYGASGTGKTMLANAIATKLARKILLINFPTLGSNEAGMIIKMIFREAKIHNAIIFFDECESLFQSRDNGSRNVNMLLTELERYDGLSIMATNRPSDLDEAMHRRITLAIEFKKPDHLLREKIWSSLKPEKLAISDDVDILELALKFELTGGFIKNAWLSALSFAVARGGKSPVVTNNDLRKAASHQLRGRLGLVDFDRRIIPTRGLEDVILAPEIKSTLQDIVNFGKAESILFGQWGFGKQHGGSKGIGALFYGPPGTGKTMAAEAMGYDLGRPIKVVNCAQLMSKWVGESAKNIQSVFDEAKAVDAILVFDEAEGLFGTRSSGDTSASRHDVMNVGVLLHHIETFSGIVVVITNLKDHIDSAFFRRFKFVLEFSKPTVAERLQLWQLLIPKETPLHSDVNLNDLAARFDFAGGDIKSAVFRAACRAALRGVQNRHLTMTDLVKSCEEESGKTHNSINYAMYS